MGRRYSINGTRAVANSLKTILNLVGGTTIRPRVYDLVFGTSGTPADNALNWIVQRSTTAGTAGSSVTPQALDPGDPAAIATSGTGSFSVEPTYTSGAILLSIDSNQRATQRWVAAPGSELVVPATANNGMGLQTTHASYSSNADATILYEE